ncbi:MAG: NAD(P)-dependent oxidoreductase [Lentisphaerae bacterium]|jgi:UDP-glucose 4-epimerase|nr:NAD(P)-dependent oxidoreductase [Lentisphaerota bacterium]MBT4822506.1 NAD(P)-dependent oxidoreductase [Lentisphaerota bacterium]MBT5605980.1 NAD(P)-dependent oxidoreductase [Lentisphaerota bacterium]MBT7060550.1 NAD(P)-dependent oxidoreductase [Lentisphaerota bacterium]MBT7848003.1 NAD(P)-dependent oxidoreductase [Lentisphaerota bacterium]
MQIRNILITGGSGKIGKNVLPELVAAGYCVRAIQHEAPITLPGVDTMEGDLGDPALAPKAIEDMDAVIHLANVKECRETFMRTNVQGTFQLLDACKNSGHIKQFIQAGSDARAGIYFSPRPNPLDETFPHSAYPGYYAFSKVLEETMCEQYRIQYKLPITVLRFSWVYDEDDILAHATLLPPHFGVPTWRDLAHTPEQKEFFEKGIDAVACMVHPDGKPCIRHVVSIRDVVHGVLQAVGNQSAIGAAFAIAAPSAFAYDVMSEYASRKLDIPVVRFVNEIAHDFQHSLAKSRSILGYNPQCDIFRIVDDAVAFRKSGRQRSPLKYPG